VVRGRGGEREKRGAEREGSPLGWGEGSGDDCFTHAQTRKEREETKAKNG